MGRLSRSHVSTPEPPSPRPIDLWDFEPSSPSVCSSHESLFYPWLVDDVLPLEAHQFDDLFPYECPSTGKNNENRVVQMMPTHVVLDQLRNNGCDDVSDQLVVPEYPDFPFKSHGGSADVYKGSLVDGTQVAIKCLRLGAGRPDEQMLKAASREIHAWSTCRHPNVYRLLGVAEYRRQFAIISPWMPHGSLNEYLITSPEVDRLNLCRQITEGIAYLHREKIVHGDIKAGNILISTDGTPVLAEFGYTTIRDHSLQFTNSTEGINLSLRWAAPELLEEPGTPTTNSDVYSLGMTILEVMTGFEPYTGLKTLTVWHSILCGKLPERPEKFMPTGDSQADLLWALLRDCWAYEPRSRPIAMHVQGRMWDIKRGSTQMSRPSYPPYPPDLMDI